MAQCRWRRGEIREAASMSEEEKKEELIREEDEYGNILVYPAWSKKNAPKDGKDRWDVPIYL